MRSMAASTSSAGETSPFSTRAASPRPSCSAYSAKAMRFLPVPCRQTNPLELRKQAQLARTMKANLTGLAFWRPLKQRRKVSQGQLQRLKSVDAVDGPPGWRSRFRPGHFNLAGEVTRRLEFRLEDPHADLASTDDVECTFVYRGHRAARNANFSTGGRSCACVFRV